MPLGLEVSTVELFALALGCLGVFSAVKAAAVSNVFLCTKLSVSWYLRMTGFLFSY